MRTSSFQQLSRRPWTQLACVTMLAYALGCSVPTMASAEEPRGPTLGGSGGENLTVGIGWGLYEEPEAESPNSVSVVGAPMPLVMGLQDSGTNRLFMFIQRRVANGPYCAETPAQLEDLSVDLTAAEGNPTIPGPEYSETYVWTPTAAGEFVLCTYLDATPSGPPTAMNFVKLTADPAPGQLSFAISPDGPLQMSVKVEGTAVVGSKVAAAIQEQGLPCTRSDGGLAGQALAETQASSTGASSPVTFAAGPFSAAYAFAAAKPGNYEVCASLTPASTERMRFARPYAVGSADFSVSGDEEAPNPHAIVLPPTLSAASMSRSRFRVAHGSAHGPRSVRVGTAFNFELSAPATVTIAITRLLAGSWLGQRCVPLRAGVVPTRARRCSRPVGIGSIVRPAAAGEDTIRFGGRMGHQELAPGSYIAQVTAQNANGSSASIGLRFSVVR